MAITRQEGKYLVHVRPQHMSEFHRKTGWWIIGGDIQYRAHVSFDDCQPRYFEYYSIAQMWKGMGRLLIHPKRKTVTILPGDYIIVTPGTINRYGSEPGCEYVEDSLWFYGSVPDYLSELGMIPQGVARLTGGRQLPAIIEAARDPGYRGQMAAVLALQQLLLRVAEAMVGNQPRQNARQTVMSVLDQVRAEPDKWWNISGMAQQCQLSDDQFRRHCMALTGHKPKHYVEQIKLQHAAKLLGDTHLSLAEIAEMLNYRDFYHFSRRFSRYFGISPGRYRNQCSK